MKESKYKLHLVKLDESVINNWRHEENKPAILYAHVKNHIFAGYLENISGASLYFASEDNEGLIIVPSAWVKWCIPIDKKEE